MTVLLTAGPALGVSGATSLSTAGDSPESSVDDALLVPDPARSAAVMDRAVLLRRIETLNNAARRLTLRDSGDDDSLVAIQSELAAVRRTLVSDTSDELLAAGELFELGVAIFPVDELRRMFHNDWNEPRSGGRRHRGTDLLAEFGVSVRAIEDGTIGRISTGSLGGNAVYFEGSSGSRYYYAHLDEFADISEGQNLLAGEPIGTIGDSGNARGTPHLHIQWDPSGESDWQNPYPLLQALYEDELGSLTLRDSRRSLPATFPGLA